MKLPVVGHKFVVTVVVKSEVVLVGRRHFAVVNCLFRYPINVNNS
jgi:hypothetical protein